MRAMFMDTKGQVRSGWKALGFFALVALLGVAASIVTRPGASFWKGGAGAFLAVAIAPLLALAASVVCVRLERRSLSTLGLRLDHRWLAQFALGTAGGVLLLVLVGLVVRASGAFHWERNPAFGAAQLGRMAWTFLGVAVFEELTFRGYPFQRLLQGALGEKGTLALFALFFSITHWSNPGMAGATKVWATLNIALAAVLLGLTWIRSGSLALPIGIHLGWNWCQGPLLGFQVSGTGGAGWWRPVLHAGSPDWLHGGAFGLEATLACAILCALACIGLWFWRPARPA